MPVLSFKELSSSRSDSPAGEDLEALVRELGRQLGLDPAWAGRGADQGRDLFFVEHRRGPLGSRNLRWLVSCKDFANSGRSVSEADAGSVLDKVAQHQAHGYLLVTTTTASAGLKAMLDGIHASGNVETRVWDKHELENFLLQDANIGLVKRFLPASYSAFQRLNSLPQTLDSLQALLPGPVYSSVQKIIETYQAEDTWLTGEIIWPHDRASAKTIDRAIAALLARDAPSEAARILVGEEIEFDAVEAALKTLKSFRPSQTQDLCREIVRAQDAGGASLYAYRFYVDHYEPANEVQIALAVALTNDDLHELYADETAAFIGEELISNAAQYQAWNDLDLLSSRTILEGANVVTLNFTAGDDKTSINFKAAVKMWVTLTYDGAASNSFCSFPGVAEGSIDANGMYIRDVTVDTSSHFE